MEGSKNKNFIIIFITINHHYCYYYLIIMTKCEKVDPISIKGNLFLSF
uniref:Uncharacterized protein n=1 Tax=Rhizophora mucronata TaxID=61149 RepID=A0A2P2KN94_RHIMU